MERTRLVISRTLELLSTQSIAEYEGRFLSTIFDRQRQCQYELYLDIDKVDYLCVYRHLNCH